MADKCNVLVGSYYMYVSPPTWITLVHLGSCQYLVRNSYMITDCQYLHVDKKSTYLVVQVVQLCRLQRFLECGTDVEHSRLDKYLLCIFQQHALQRPSMHIISYYNVDSPVLFSPVDP